MAPAVLLDPVDELLLQALEGRLPSCLTGEANLWKGKRKASRYCKQ